MFALLRQRNFALLWFAGLISVAGDWFLIIALPFHIYDRTGSALATGGMFIAQTVPRVLLGSLAGVFVDRWDRRRTLVVADLTRAALLLPLLAVGSRAALPLVYLVAILQAAIAQFFIPAKGALLPRLVAEVDLLPANGLTALSDNLTRLVGPALGGLLYGALGLPAIVLGDAASFLLSGLLLAAIALPFTDTPAAISARRGAGTVWREWVAGLRLVGRSRLLTGLFAIMGIVMIGEGILNVLLIPFIKDVLGGDATHLGWLLSAQAIGGLAGGLLVGRVSGRLTPSWLIALGGICDGVLLLAIINSRSFTAALALITLAGLPTVWLFVSIQTMLQERTINEYRGRVFGAFGTIAALLTLVGMALAGLLGDRLGVVRTLDLAGIAYLFAGLLALAVGVMGRGPRTVGSTTGACAAPLPLPDKRQPFGRS